MKNKLLSIAVLSILVIMPLVFGFNDELNWERENGKDLQIMYEVNPPVHQFISYQGYLMLNGSMKSEFDRYIGSESECVFESCGSEDIGTKITEGAYEEDSFLNWMNHFWNPNNYGGLCFSFVCYDSALEIAQHLWAVYVLENYQENPELSYYYLGRVAHLLEDVSVPAHVHNDAHWGPYGRDSYEDYMSEHFNEYDLEFFESNGITPIIADNIPELFLSMAEIADDYDSDDANGEVDKGVRRMCDELELNCDIDNENVSLIAEQIMPKLFQHIAGLYRLFWIETNSQVEACSSGVCCDEFWKMTSENCIKDKDKDGFCEKGYFIFNKTLQCPLEDNNTKFGTDCDDNNEKVVPPFNLMRIKNSIEFCPGEFEIKDLIIINNSNVEVLCNGTTIKGDDSEYIYGIYANSQINLTIKNCRITDFYNGIYFTDVKHGLIENNSVISNLFGVALHYSSEVVIKDNYAQGNNKGFLIGNSSNIEIFRNFALDNIEGIFLGRASNENKVLNNQIKKGLYGIRLQNNSLNLIKGNYHFDNRHGIALFGSDKNNITENWINNSYYHGFYADPESDYNHIWKNEFFKKGIEDWDYKNYNVTDNFYCVNGINNSYYFGAEGLGCVNGNQDDNSEDDDKNILEVFSPLDSKIYNHKNILINISGNKIFDWIVYKYFNKKTLTTLCRGCQTYVREKRFSDGRYNLSFQAIKDDKIADEFSVSFVVDTEIPKIIRTYPKKNSFVNKEFGIRYDKEGIREVSIFYNGENLNGFKVLDCENVGDECWTQVDLEDYNGELKYYFIVEDIAGNIAKSKPIEVFVDSKKPEIKNIDYSVNRRNFEFVIEVNEPNLNKILYKINNGSWKMFCVRLKNGTCSNTIKLYSDNQIIKFAAVDKAGNFDEKEIKISI